MAGQLGLSPSLVSHHLRRLRAARLLQAERRRWETFNLVTDQHIRSLLADMEDHLANGEAKAEALPTS